MNDLISKGELFAWYQGMSQEVKVVEVVDFLKKLGISCTANPL